MVCPNSNICKRFISKIIVLVDVDFVSLLLTSVTNWTMRNMLIVGIEIALRSI